MFRISQNLFILLSSITLIRILHFFSVGIEHCFLADMSNAESTTRPQKDHPNPSKGRPGPERHRGSLQSTHSTGWGWPRFVSVEVDVEEKRRQKPNEMAPVNATGEISRPEQGARNQSFQKAHEHASQPYLRRKASQNPEEPEE